MGKQYEVVWTNLSQKQMRQLFDCISKDSVQNASKVVKNVTAAISKVIDNPEFYPVDKYKTANDGSYRAFEKHHYRVSYRFTKMPYAF